MHILKRKKQDKNGPQHSEFFIKGNRAAGEKKFEDAIVYFTNAIKNDGSYAAAYNNRGLVFLELGKNEDAISDFTSAIAIAPEYINAYNNRGLAYQRAGLYEEAADDFYRADNIDPDYSLLGTRLMPEN